MADGTISFFGMAEYYSIVQMYHSFSILLLIDGHVGCFHILAIIYGPAINTGVHISFGISVLDFFGYTPRSGIAGS